MLKLLSFQVHTWGEFNSSAVGDNVTCNEPRANWEVKNAISKYSLGRTRALN
jgi:hypothetical protein